MKLILLLCLTVSLVHGQTVADIADDFSLKAKAACERIDATLTREASQIAASLVKASDTIGADTVSTQVTAKLKGDPVPMPRPELALLFQQYDTARTSLLRPVKETSLMKLDALLVKSGKDMKIVMEAAKTRETIEALKLPATQKLPPFLAKLKFPLEWDYFSTSDLATITGEVVMNADGTFFLKGPPGSGAATPGTWKPTSKSTEFAVELRDGEKGLIVTKGRLATYTRPVGNRYLRAK